MTATEVVDDARLTVTEPGVYDDMPERVYLADPVLEGSLSFSGAKALLPPSCPARYRHYREHGRPPKPAFDFGHAVHSLVLGSGEPIVTVDAPDWRGKAAREQRDAAYAAGHVPMLTADLAAARAAAESVTTHPIAGELLSTGIAERSLLWRDDKHGVWRRSRLDWMTERNGRTIVVDLKTCVSAEPGAIAKAVAQYRYYMQHPFYLDGVRALGLAAGDTEPAYLFVFVEKESPHLVTVVQLDDAAVAAGEAANDRALGIYARCSATDTWPSYTNDIPAISLPPWALREEDLT